MGRYLTFRVTLCSLFFPLLLAQARWNPVLRLPSDGGDDFVGTRWAVLIAGSSGYGNYRHQADICHAYQILRNGGLKDENIIVFMYDDIAYNEENPRQGVIINHPQGGDVYGGVPKDYVGKDVTVNNFLAAILGNKNALTGGSGKVVNSGPDDHIFIFYSDHGGPGVLSMPTYPSLYADDFIAVLKEKHASGSYKSMVIYIEACEAGSIFEGLLPENINIYATTASNAEESSWATYCPGGNPDPPLEFETCLGDLYSVSWMEDSDIHNLRTETLKQQYQLVKSRTSDDNTYNLGSHAMQYGELDLNKEQVFLYLGSNPANDNFTFNEYNSLPSTPSIVNQWDAELLYYWYKFHRSPEGSSKKLNAERELHDIITHRMHVDSSISLIGNILFGTGKGVEVLKAIRPKDLPLVDDWDCLRTMVRTFEAHCGSLSQYGMKHMRSLANICNAGVKEQTMKKVSSEVCPQIPSISSSSLQRGFSA